MGQAEARVKFERFADVSLEYAHGDWIEWLGETNGPGAV